LTAAQQVLIVGCPRSGTTLLQCMLGAHSRVLTFPESHALGALLTPNRLLRMMGLASRPNIARMRRFLAEIGAVPPRALRYPISARRSVRLFCESLDDLATREDRSCWVEKTPAHIYSVPRLERWVPELRFVHVVREGADTIASHYEATHRHPEEFGGGISVDRAIDIWKKSIEISRQCEGTRRHTIVRYDQLVTQPERSLKRICTDLGLTYEPAMRHAYGHQYEQSGASAEPWKLEVGKPLRLSRGEKFESVFEAGQRGYILERIRDVALPGVVD